MQYHNILIRNSEDGNMTLVMSLDLVLKISKQLISLSNNFLNFFILGCLFF